MKILKLIILSGIGLTYAMEQNIAPVKEMPSQIESYQNKSAQDKLTREEERAIHDRFIEESNEKFKAIQKHKGKSCCAALSVGCCACLCTPFVAIGSCVRNFFQPPR